MQRRPHILVVVLILALAGWVMYTFDGGDSEVYGSIAVPGLLGALLLWRYGDLAARAERTGEFRKTALVIIAWSVVAAVMMVASGTNRVPEGSFQTWMRGMGALMMVIQALALMVTIL